MKKIISVILLMCVFIVSVMSFNVSAVDASDMTGVYNFTNWSFSGRNLRCYGLFYCNNNYYNEISFTKNSIILIADNDQNTSFRLWYYGSFENPNITEVSILKLYYPSTAIYNFASSLLLPYKTSDIVNVSVLPNHSYLLGEWVLKDQIELITYNHGMVYFSIDDGSANGVLYGEFSGSPSLGTWGYDLTSLFSYFTTVYSSSSGSWVSSKLAYKNINIIDTFFINDDVALSYYNWLLNNAISHNGIPVNPPDTQPPDTQPPDTQPPDTQPPDTETPDTETPDTDTPVIPPADRFGFQEMMAGLSYSLFGNGGLVVQIWSWLVSPAVLPFFGIGIALALLLLAILIVKRTF